MTATQRRRYRRERLEEGRCRRAARQNLLTIPGNQWDPPSWIDRCANRILTGHHHID